MLRTANCVFSGIIMEDLKFVHFFLILIFYFFRKSLLVSLVTSSIKTNILLSLQWVIFSHVIHTSAIRHCLPSCFPSALRFFSNSYQFVAMSDSQTDYKFSLPPNVRLRYEWKTKGIGNVNPYTTQEKDYGRDRMAWPDVTYIDMYSYLVRR